MKNKFYVVFSYGTTLTTYGTSLAHINIKKYEEFVRVLKYSPLLARTFEPYETANILKQEFVTDQHPLKSC